MARVVDEHGYQGAHRHNAQEDDVQCGHDVTLGWKEENRNMFLKQLITLLQWKKKIIL